MGYIGLEGERQAEGIALVRSQALWGLQRVATRERGPGITRSSDLLREASNLAFYGNSPNC